MVLYLCPRIVQMHVSSSGLRIGVIPKGSPAAVAPLYHENTTLICGNIKLGLSQSKTLLTKGCLSRELEKQYECGEHLNKMVLCWYVRIGVTICYMLKKSKIVKEMMIANGGATHHALVCGDGTAYDLRLSRASHYFIIISAMP